MEDAESGRAGDGFDAFYAATYRRVVGQVFAMVGNLGEAEDATAEAYARAWQRWSKVGEYGDPQAWVRTVAYRIAVSHWRRTVRRLHAYRRHGASADLPGIEPDQIALAAALSKISNDQRRAIVLHHLVGLSVQEISAETNVPTGTVKAWLARGRRALATHLSEYADEPRRAPKPKPAPKSEAVAMDVPTDAPTDVQENDHV